MADQNYVQKYVSVSNIKEVKRSIWTAMGIYIPLTAVFLYIGSALFMYYYNGGLPADITKGDQVFPYFIATQVPVGLKGLIIAAIVAAAMSTVDSALNCSATVSLLDFVKPYLRKPMDERSSVIFLRTTTIVWGILGTGFALFMINAKSSLDVWWQISGIFGGAILGLFLLALANRKISTGKGISGIVVNIATIVWGTFARDLPAGWEWFECTLEPILVGALGTFILLLYLLAISSSKKQP
jgi:SSS family solute:Na+ symporter